MTDSTQKMSRCVALANFSLNDIDGGEDLDALLQFRTQETGIQCGDRIVSCGGKTLDEQLFRAEFSMTRVGCN
jgi:hypothetical protein